ncbi:hypothetical protein GCM10027452_00340 [Micromonospora halotolerans]
MQRLDGALAVGVEDARITGLYYVRNPEKLTRLGSATPLTLRRPIRRRRHGRSGPTRN